MNNARPARSGRDLLDERLQQASRSRMADIVRRGLVDRVADADASARRGASGRAHQLRAEALVLSSFLDEI